MYGKKGLLLSFVVAAATFAGCTPADHGGGDAPDPWVPPPCCEVEPEPPEDGFTQLLFSRPGGVYGQPFELEIWTSYGDAVIRYTLDGSAPHPGSPAYAGPVPIQDRTEEPNVFSEIRTNWLTNSLGYRPPKGPIFKATVVRAQLWREDGPLTRVQTHTYLVGNDLSSRYPLLKVSLATTGANFFDDDVGIYVPGSNWVTDMHELANYSQSGREWERPVHLEIFEENGRRSVALDAGARIHGGVSRWWPQKSLRLYFRGDYGENRLRYQVFRDKPHSDFNRLLLRNFGNDWPHALIRDSMMQRLVRDTHLDIQHARPAVVFLNGEFWGLHVFRDRLDEHHLASHHQIESADVVIVEGTGTLRAGEPGDEQLYSELLEFMEDADLTTGEAYAAARARIDVDNFIDYQVLQIYVGNMDWPHNNIRAWRVRAGLSGGTPGQDGRWRWLVFDLDNGFGLGLGDGAETHDGIAHATAAERGRFTLLLRRMLESPSFRRAFVTRFLDQLNTAFAPDRAIEEIDSLTAEIGPVVAEHIYRWNHPVTVDRWHSNVERLRRFARERPAPLREHLANHFGLGDPWSVRISIAGPRGGAVRVNTVVHEGPAQWEGVYLRGLPVRIKPVPSTGVCFVGWEGTNQTSPELLFEHPEEDVQLMARFAEEGDPSCVPLTHRLARGAFRFDRWRSDEPAGIYPGAMIFEMIDEQDPRLDDEPTCVYDGPYDLTSRTRINGLGDDGVAFVNTGNSDFCGRLGTAVVSLDTRGVRGIEVSWTGGTLAPNSREYALRLQYRAGDEGPFLDVHDGGAPVEYVRSAVAGDEIHLGPVTLPSDAEDQPLVQLRWKYYFTGVRHDEDSGARTQLRLDDIEIRGEERPPPGDSAGN